jgi:hypothetical protein
MAVSVEPRTGRPSKCSPERVEAILAMLRAGNTRSAAAAAAGVDRSQLWRWMARDATFRNAIEKAEAEAKLRFVGQIDRAVTDGTWQAAAWWLERRRPDAWGKRERVDLTVRREAERLAAELGVDAAELVREAERIAAGARG